MTGVTGSVEELLQTGVTRALETFGLPCRVEVLARPLGSREPWTAVLHPELSSPLTPRRWTQVANAAQTLVEAALVQAGRPEVVLVSLAEPSGRPSAPREDVGLVGAAKALAELVLRTERPCALGPMSVADRRLVHQALGEVRGVWTQSEGDGIYRRLWILPRGKAAVAAPAAPVEATEPAPGRAEG